MCTQATIVNIAGAFPIPLGIWLAAEMYVICFAHILGRLRYQHR